MTIATNLGFSRMGPHRELKKALDRWPRASWQVARSRLLWVSIRGMIDGELPDPSQQRGLARVPLRALAIMGRGAG